FIFLVPTVFASNDVTYNSDNNKIEGKYSTKRKCNNIEVLNELKNNLTILGFDEFSESVDNLYDKSLMGAVKDFQSKFDLKRTGLINKDTNEKMMELISEMYPESEKVRVYNICELEDQEDQQELDDKQSSLDSNDQDGSEDQGDQQETDDEQGSFDLNDQEDQQETDDEQNSLDSNDQDESEDQEDQQETDDEQNSLD